MVVHRLLSALLIGSIALVASFVLINALGVAWAMYASPRDGQAGIGPFLLSLVAAPGIALVTFVIVATHPNKNVDGHGS